MYELGITHAYPEIPKNGVQSHIFRHSFIQDNACAFNSGINLLWNFFAISYTA